MRMGISNLNKISKLITVIYFIFKKKYKNQKLDTKLTVFLLFILINVSVTKKF